MAYKTSTMAPCVALVLLLAAFANAEEGKHTRFEYKLSFKGPHLVNKQGKVPFWNHYGSAIPSDEQVRITPSIKDQKGGLFTKTSSTNEFWEVEVSFKVSGRGRVGGDGLAIWFTEDVGHPGPVFGASDKWKGMGLFFDSFDNDGEQNNPYVMVMLNDGTKEYDHNRDGNNQQLGGCMRDFRNRPHAVRARIRYYNNILTVFYHGGMSLRDEDYELCMRAENVHLPKTGYFGVSAATGGLADDHDVLSFLTYSLTPPLTAEQKAKLLSEDQRKKYEEQYGEYAKKLETQKEEFQKEHPDKFKQPEEKYESVYERDIRLIYEASNAVHQLVMSLHGKTGELTKEINQLHSAVGQLQAAGSRSDGPSKQEINTLTSLQNQVLALVKEQQQRLGNVADTQRLDALNSSIRMIQDNVGHLLTKAQLASKQDVKAPECAKTNCITTGYFIFFLVVQILIVAGYLFHRNHQERAAKKFY